MDIWENLYCLKYKLTQRKFQKKGSKSQLGNLGCKIINRLTELSLVLPHVTHHIICMRTMMVPGGVKIQNNPDQKNKIKQNKTNF